MQNHKYQSPDSLWEVRSASATRKTQGGATEELSISLVEKMIIRCGVYQTSELQTLEFKNLETEKWKST